MRQKQLIIWGFHSPSAHMRSDNWSVCVLCVYVCVCLSVCLFQLICDPRWGRYQQPQCYMDIEKSSIFICQCTIRRVCILFTHNPYAYMYVLRAIIIRVAVSCTLDMHRAPRVSHFSAFIFPVTNCIDEWDSVLKINFQYVNCSRL